MILQSVNMFFVMKGGNLMICNYHSPLVLHAKKTGLSYETEISKCKLLFKLDLVKTMYYCRTDQNYYE